MSLPLGYELLAPSRPAALRQADRCASVLALHRPSAASIAVPIRLTRRGILAATAVVVAVATLLVATAVLCAPARTTPSAPAAPGTVTVHPGDTLWQIAARIAPGRDPRAEIAELRRLNRLHGAALTPGQALRTR